MIQRSMQQQQQFPSGKMAAKAGPLAKIKVLEFAGLAPVPLAGKILADFGASVIRVDKFESSFAEDVLSQGKKSIVVNLKRPQGVDVIKRLTKSADVLIEPFRPNVMERLGLGPKDLLKEHERLIYARLTGTELATNGNLNLVMVLWFYFWNSY